MLPGTHDNFEALRAVLGSTADSFGLAKLCLVSSGARTPGHAGIGSCKHALLRMTSGGCTLCGCEPRLPEDDCKLFAQLHSDTLSIQSLRKDNAPRMQLSW